MISLMRYLAVICPALYVWRWIYTAVLIRAHQAHLCKLVLLDICLRAAEYNAAYGMGVPEWDCF